MNLQIAATLSGRVAAIGPVPLHGARHDPHAFAASGLKDLLAGLPAAADLGYTGVEGITIVPFRTPPGGQLHDSQTAFNKQLSSIRAAAERAAMAKERFRGH
jgi:DDE superfamily endonuclease